MIPSFPGKILCIFFFSLLWELNADQEPNQPKSSNKVEIAPANKKSAVKKPEVIFAEKKSLKIHNSLSGFVQDMDSVEISVDTDHWNELKVIQPPKQGVLVKKGEILLRLDQQKLKRQIQNLNHELSILEIDRNILQVELKLAENLAPLQLQELKRSERYVKEDFDRFQNIDLPFQKKSMEMNLKRSEDYLLYSQEELNQLKKMYAEDDLTEETEEIILQRAKNDVAYMQFYLENAQRSFEDFQNVNAPRSQTAMKDHFDRENLVISALKKTHPTKLKLQQLRLKKLEQSRKELLEKKKQLEEDLKLLSVVSPVNGKLFWGTFERGKWSGPAAFKSKLLRGSSIKAYEPILTVCPIKDLQVKIDIPEKDLPSFHKGLEGNLIFQLKPDHKIEARVVELASTAHSPGFYSATLAFSLPKDFVIPDPGSKCTFQYTAYENKSAFVVPEKVIFSDDFNADQKYIFILTKQGKHKKRVVQVGRKTGSSVEIIAGVKRQDQILIEKPKS